MSLLKRIGTTGSAEGAAPATPDGWLDGVDLQSTDSMTAGALGTRTLAGSGSLGTAGLTRPALGGQQAPTGTQRRPSLSQTNGPRGDSFNDLKSRVQNRLIAELDPRMDLSNADEVRRTVEETFTSVLESESIVLTRVERLRLFEAIAAERSPGVDRRSVPGRRPRHAGH
jgi:pilus assembly protein CpaF